MQYYEKPIAIFKKVFGNDHPYTITTLRNLENAAHLFANKIQGSKNEKEIISLISVNKKLIDVYLLENKWLLAYEVAGRTEKLLQDFKKETELMEIYEKLWNNFNEIPEGEKKPEWLPQSGIFCLVYGKKLKKKGRWNEGLPVLNKAKDIFKKTGNQEGMASACLELGELFEIFNDYDLSRWTYKDALRFSKRLKHEERVAVTESNLARLEIKTGLFDDAVNHLEDALKHFLRTKNSQKADQVKEMLELAHSRNG